jgi:hypothetical protein
VGRAGAAGGADRHRPASALLGDGRWNALSAIALGMPVAVGAWFGLRRK